jgi:hypothetical protein
MWLIFGSKEKTERVPNGRVVERVCESCHERAMFYERQATTTLQFYFFDVLDYGKRTVMACGACGTLFATDELARAELGAEPAQPSLSEIEQATSTLKGLVRKAGARISDEARQLFGDEPLPQPSTQPASASSASEVIAGFQDPLTSDEEAMEAKFRELERKFRIGD